MGSHLLELCARSGSPLTERVAAGLCAAGHHITVVDGPTGVAPWIDLALERSADGLRPPDATFETSSVPGIVVTSTLAYAPSERHIGLAPEDWGRARTGTVAAAWRDFELGAAGDRTAILRAAPTPVVGGRDAFSRWLEGRVVSSVFGFDPCLQLLHPDDLIFALRWALDVGAESSRGTTLNIVPTQPIFVRQAIRAAGKRRLALPTSLVRRGQGEAVVEHLRYPFTARGERAAERGWRAQHSSQETAANLGDHHARANEVDPSEVDPLGLSPDYIGRFEKTLFRFLHDAYWRIEYRGLEYLPQTGGAVLVGVHRGFMPWDGIMMLVACHRQTGRYPRFLVHPALVKLPVLAPYMNKNGGVVACQENADWLLARGNLLGIFPEGIRGAFKHYRDWHRVGRFGRDTFVRLALRHQVPIIPFTTVGSAEIHPIWGEIQSSAWRRVAEWPFIPITSPVPLPSKWHTEILPPINLPEHHGPDAADNPAIVEEISQQVRQTLQASIDGMRSARKSIFFGRLFKEQ